VLSTWSTLLQDDADILLFGCNVGEGELGYSFVKTLAELTGADVAASDDLTGHESHGGDWELEVSYGATRTISADESNSLQQWTRPLATVNITYRNDDMTFDINTITMTDVITMVNNGIDVSLRAAIAAANNTAGDDTINLFGPGPAFDLENGSIAVGLDTDPTATLTIVNRSVGHVVIDNNEFVGNTRIFDLNYGQLVLEGDPDSNGVKMTLRDGNPNGTGGAVFGQVGTTLDADSIYFFRNYAGQGTGPNPYQNGGAIFSFGDVTIAKSDFFENNGLSGGGIYAQGSLTVADTLFRENVAHANSGNVGGGAILSTQSITVTNSDFIENSTQGNGGAILAYGNLTVIKGKLTGNITDGQGAFFSSSTITVSEIDAKYNNGTAVWANDNAIITDSSFTENIGSGSVVNGVGAAAVHANGQATVTNTTFTENSTAGFNVDGGAVSAGVKVKSVGSTFTENRTDKDGGAIFSSGSVEIENSHFELNTAENGSGGAVSGNGGGYIHTSSFFTNTAQYGSAVLANGGTLNIERVTFSGNTTDGGPGGALYADNGAVVNVKASTFADNESNNAVGPAAINVDTTAANPSTVNVLSSIFSNNTNDGVSSDVLNTISQGYNMYSGTAPTGLSFNSDLDNHSVSLLLGSAAALPGVSPVVVRPVLAGSPAINAGTVTDANASPSQVSLNDAQGLPHDGLPDSGASEFQEPSDVIFWSADDGKIYRSDATYTNVFPVVTSPNLTPTFTPTIVGVVVDANGADNNGVAKIYWLELESGQVYRASLDGSGVSVVLNVQDGMGTVLTATSMTMDIDTDRIYVTSEATGGEPAGIRVWEVG